MSKISPDFIHSVGYLYEEINVQQQDFLNEESEYYDAEAAELVEDILSCVCLSMVHEGYSANAIIGFLADSSEQEIIEKYLSFDENILTESTVSKEYIDEQLEILDEGIGALLRVGKALFKGAKYAKDVKGIAPLARLGSGLKAAGTATERIAAQGPKASAVVRPALGKAVQAVKDFGSKAKTALTGPTAQKIAKGAGIFGLGAAGGYLGAKLAGAGSKPEAQKPSPTPAKPPAAPAKPSGGSPAPASPKPKPQADSGTQKYKDLIKAGKTKEAEALGMQQWAKANPKLAAKLKPDGTQKGTGQSQMEKDAEELRRMADRSKQRQGELMGGPEGPGKINTKEADDALKAQQKRDMEKAKKDAEKAASSMKESHEPYEIILEYLMDRGHADTIEEAHYIMLEMDTDAVGAIMQEYQDYVLAEEISEWVDGLINEGYDFSEYSWDDVVEYYVTEAKYGTAKGRKALAKKVRKGEDVGKKGAGFEAIVKKASGKYGKERATKIAAAAMWKNLGGKKEGGKW